MMTRLATLKDRRRAYSLIAAVALLAAWALPVGSGRVAVPEASVVPAISLPDLGGLPISFEPNAGQTDPSVRYMAHAPGGLLYFTPSEVVLSLSSAAGPAAPPDTGRDAARHAAAPADASLRIEFQGSNPDVLMQSSEMLAGRVNYLLGSDPSKWRTDLPTYAGVSYLGLYPGIDLAYDGAGGRLKGTYTVMPGADSSLIRWRYSGAESVSLDQAGNIAVRVGSGHTVVESAPVAWQETGAGRVAVAASYVIGAGGDAGFMLGSYNPALPLIIDPALELPYSTYLGGSSVDQGEAIATDGLGNVYVTGFTFSTNFPILNPYQGEQPGVDAFVTKLNTNAGGVLSLVYSTYLGGEGADYARDIAVDGAGNAYVTGYTESTTFPILNQLQGNQLGTDGFVTRLNAAGSAIAYSTYLGGGGEDYGSAIAVDGTGHAYVAGSTTSTTFPTTPTRYQGDQPLVDVFVTRLNTNASGAASLVYSTYLGGTDTDNCYAVAVDGAGHAYVTGYTDSSNFPTRNPLLAYQGAGDAFVARLNTNAAGASSLAYSTYLGGTGVDQGEAIAVDGAGHAYVAGVTGSINFPTVSAYQGDQPIEDAFVARLNTNAVGMAALVYSTYLGGSGIDEAEDIATNGAGDAYVVGWTNSTDLPLRDQYQGDQPLQDAFVARLNTNAAAAASLIYSTYLGGSGTDQGKGIAVDMAGNRANAYVTGYTFSANFPVAFQYQSDQGDIDAFVARLAEATNTSTPIPTVTPTSTPLPTNTPLPVPTNTPVPAETATPCPITFSDVQPTDYFFEPVRYLYCRGVISGYADNTFRPYADTTRGQLAKIIVLAEGFPITTPAGPTFTDVPAENVFYPFVETAAARQIVSGYADGTFRPFNNVTRGQLSKIVVVADGWPLVNPPTPRFTDVPPENPFYTYIETAASRGIISGYADGTFRWGNNATRGQISKIVYLAVTGP